MDDLDDAYQCVQSKSFINGETSEELKNQDYSPATVLIMLHTRHHLPRNVVIDGKSVIVLEEMVKI